VTAHRTRNWWRNLEAHPEVELRLAGRTFTGRGRVLTGEEAMSSLVEFLEAHPSVARGYAVPLDEEGHADPVAVGAAARYTVVVEIELDG